MDGTGQMLDQPVQGDIFLRSIVHLAQGDEALRQVFLPEENGSHGVEPMGSPHLGFQTFSLVVDFGVHPGPPELQGEELGLPAFRIRHPG
jgi:hypothetical protein